MVLVLVLVGVLGVWVVLVLVGVLGVGVVVVLVRAVGVAGVGGMVGEVGVVGVVGMVGMVGVVGVVGLVGLVGLVVLVGLVGLVVIMAAVLVGWGMEGVAGWQAGGEKVEGGARMAKRLEEGKVFAVMFAAGVMAVVVVGELGAAVAVWDLVLVLVLMEELWDADWELG